MEFKAYLVNINGTTSINLALIGLLIFLLSIIVWLFPIPDIYGLLTTLFGISLVLIGTISDKGNGLYRVGKSYIKINTKEIEIESRIFKFEEISQLEFYYHSYYGQSPFGFFTENAGLIEYGMLNYIRFKYNDESIYERFFLGKKSHAEIFLKTIHELKSNGIAHDIHYRRFTN